jgi:hypothetical protein
MLCVLGSLHEANNHCANGLFVDSRTKQSIKGSNVTEHRTTARNPFYSLEAHVKEGKLDE